MIDNGFRGEVPDSRLHNDRPMAHGWWLSCREPHQLLDRLGACTTRRKLRLWACACVRQIWDKLDHRCKAAVVAAEEYADHLISRATMGIASKTAYKSVREAKNQELRSAATAARWVSKSRLDYREAETSPEIASSIMGYRDPYVEAYNATHAAVQLHQIDLLRDIFHSPFISVNYDNLWSTPIVLNLAQTIYQERLWETMPILADALEDAGCDDVSALEHCRSPKQHVRGCWLVDLILGKS